MIKVVPHNPQTLVSTFNKKNITFFQKFLRFTLPETNSTPLKIRHPKKERIVSQVPIFKCELLVKGRVLSLWVFFSWLQRKSLFTQEEPTTSAKQKIYITFVVPRIFPPLLHAHSLGWKPASVSRRGSRTSHGWGGGFGGPIRFPKLQIPIKNTPLILTRNCQRWVLLLEFFVFPPAPTRMFCVGIATSTSFISFHGRDEMHTSDHCLHPTKDTPKVFSF